jgi:hypothetical protein
MKEAMREPTRELPASTESPLAEEEEQLRVVLQRYRSFFDRLLGVQVEA